MTDKQKQLIEDNYLTGNLSDAKEVFSKCSKADRKEFAIDAMYRTYLMEVSNYRNKQYAFAQFLIENL